MHIRPLILLALPALASCSSFRSNQDDAAWHRIQAERLAKLHDSRDFHLALDRLRRDRPIVAAPVTASVAMALPGLRSASAQEPQPVAKPAASAATSEPVVAELPQEPQEPQEPQQPQGRKLDQILPRGPDVAARRYTGEMTQLRVSAEAGIGTVQVIAPHTTVSDRSDAAFLRVGLDSNAQAARGAALHISGFSTDDEMFNRSLINDGVVPAKADARVVGARVFPHVRLTPVDSATATATVRLGAAIGYLNIEHLLAGVDRDWLTIGPRIEIEPSWVLAGSADNRLDLFGRLNGEFGYGYFHEDFRGGSDDDHMSEWAYDAGLGLRWNVNGWSLDLGYEFGQQKMSGTHTELYDNRSGTKLESQKVFLGGSVRF